MFCAHRPGQGAGVAGHLDHDRLDGLVGGGGDGARQLLLGRGVELQQGAAGRDPVSRLRHLCPLRTRIDGSIHVAWSGFYASRAVIVEDMSTPTAAPTASDPRLPGPAGGRAGDHPAAARRLPRPVRPAARRRRPARPHRRRPARDRRRRHPRDPPGRGLARPRARPVRPHRRRRRRRPPVARLLPDLTAPAPDGCISITVKAIPTAWSATTSSAAPGPARSFISTRPPATSCCPTPAPEQGPVRHRRHRHHPGDGHAAQPTSTSSPTSCVAALARPPRPTSIFGAELRELAAAGPDPPGRAAHRRPTASSTSPTSTSLRARPGRARRPGPAGRPGCSTPPRSTGPPHGVADRLHTERFRPTRRRRRRGRHGHLRHAAAPTVEADGATPILDAGEEAGVLMPSRLPDGHLLRLRPPAARGRGPRPAHRRDHHRRPRRRRAHPDLRLRRRRRLRHRPLTPRGDLERPTTQQLTTDDRSSLMTVMQKKTRQPDRPPDAPRTSRSSASSSTRSAQEVIDSPRRAATRRTSARSSRPSASSSSAAARVLLFSLFPPAWLRRHRRPVGRQDPREHGDRPQRHARPVGLDARPEDPLDHLGVGQRLARREQWKHSHNELHHTYTNVLGKDNDLGYGIMRVDEDQRWEPVLPRPAAVELPQRLLLRVRHRGLRPRARQEPASRSAAQGPGVPARAPRQVLRKIRSQVHQGLRRPPAAVRARRSSTRSTANVDRQPGPQPVDPLGHHVRPLPRGRRDLRARRSIEGETRGEWYLRQMLGSANITGSKAMHFMTGNLSHQIEHHLFPDLPSNRYAEIAPQGAGHLFERYGLHLHHRLAAPPGRLGVEEGHPALAARPPARPLAREIAAEAVGKRVRRRLRGAGMPRGCRPRRSGRSSSGVEHAPARCRRPGAGLRPRRSAPARGRAPWRPPPRGSSAARRC